MEYIYLLKYLCKCHSVNLKTKWHTHHVIRVNVKDFMEDLTLGSYDDYNGIISTHSQRYAVFLDIFTSSISFIIFRIHVKKILIRDLFSSDVIQITIMFLILTFST